MTSSGGMGGRGALRPDWPCIAIAMMAALGVLYTAWPIWRAFFPLEISFNEGWNAYHVDAVLSSRPLYPPADALYSNNYPPLSFLTIKLLTLITGVDAVYVGRALSILAVFVIAGAVFGCIRRLGGTNLAASLGCIWFAATMPRHFDNYVGMNDPHLLALAIMAVALAWFLGSLHRNRPPVGPILLMVVAGFFKHSLLAIPATALLWLAMVDRRQFPRMLALGAGACVAGLALCVVLFGWDFIEQILFPRELSLSRALNGLERLNPVLAAGPVCALWLWRDRVSPAARFCLLFLSISFAWYFLQKFGAGMDNNAQVELVIAVAVGVGLAFDRLTHPASAPRWLRAGRGVAIPALLIANLIALPNLEPYLLVGSSDYRARFWRHTGVVRSEVARVAAITVPIWCTTWMVCRMAGKPLLYDAFSVEQRMLAGRLSPATVERRQPIWIHTDVATTSQSLDERYWLRELLRSMMQRLRSRPPDDVAPAT